MKKNTFFPKKLTNPSEPTNHWLVKEGSEQKRRKVKKGASAEATIGSAPASDVKQLTAQYNLFTTDFYDVVDRRGNIVAVKMCEHTKNKYFPKK